MSLVPQAKIAVPQLPPELVVRAGLRADLDAASSADATLVCAPAGYGKTMLLADWAHASTGSDRFDTAWVSLDRDDNDPKRLWTAVVAALAACPSVPPGSRLHAPWVWQPGEPEFLAELSDAVQQLPRPIRLILDDVHELVDPVALHGLQTLLRNRPTGLQLVLSTRFDPPLSLPRLRLAGRLCELRADRLRFSPTETADPARTIRSAPHPHPGRRPAPAHRRLGRRAAAGRTHARQDHRPRRVPRPVLRQRQLGRRLPGRGGPLRAPGRRPGVPASDQHQRPRPVRAGRPAVRPGRRREPARPARPPNLAADRHRTPPRHLPHPGTPAHLPDRRSATPRTHPGRRTARHRGPLVGRPGSADQRPGPRHPQPQPRAAVGAAAPLRRPPDPHRRPRCTAPRAHQHGCAGHTVRPVAGRDFGH